MITLSLNSLKPGQQARVRALNTTGDMRRRLQDIGLTPGTQVTCYQKSPGGDPTAFNIRGAIIALRCEDSAQVLTELL